MFAGLQIGIQLYQITTRAQWPSMTTTKSAAADGCCLAMLQLLPVEMSYYYWMHTLKSNASC
jgi:riboflavin synthase alpha subunit